MKEAYFLGANTPLGFYGLYDSFTDPKSDTALYILKGGSGCGKSTFMKRIGEKMLAHNIPIEEIYCSADPSSLDALYIPRFKTAYVDGSHPHGLDTQFAGVFDHYVHLGQYYNTQSLQKEKEAIMAQIIKGKEPYKRAYDYLAAADKIWREIIHELTDTKLIEKIEKRVNGIVTRECKHKSKAGSGNVKKRFLSSFTYEGFSDFFTTVAQKETRVYLFDNQFGLSHIALEKIKDSFIHLAYDMVACQSPMSPNKLEHILIPERKLAFISTNDTWQYQGAYYRHIRLDAMISTQKLTQAKKRIKFSKKVRGMLWEEAICALTLAREEHVALEALYNPHVDFNGVLALADKHAKALLKTQ